jgi:hypothetical protein
MPQRPEPSIDDDNSVLGDNWSGIERASWYDARVILDLDYTVLRPHRVL